MTERFNLRINITHEPACEGCRIGSWNFITEKTETTTTFGPGVGTCRIAQMEKELERIPTYGEVEDTLHILGRYHFNIPANCPNKYLKPSDVPASRRKK